MDNMDFCNDASGHRPFCPLLSIQVHSKLFFQSSDNRRSSSRKPSNNRFFYGLVSSSRRVRYSMASVRFFPHISSEGCSEEHTAGRAGSLKIRQRIFSSRCMHAVPAGFPSGMPGIGDDMEGAVQHAPQCGRQRNFSDVTMFSSCKHIQFIKLFCGEGICCDHCRHHGLFCGIFHQFHAVKG